MYGPQLIEMAQVTEQEHMLKAVMERQRRELREVRGPGRFARAWAAFWAAGDYGQASRVAANAGIPTDFVPCTDC
jgi:hypothetical protein